MIYLECHRGKTKLFQSNKPVKVPFEGLQANFNLEFKIFECDITYITCMKLHSYTYF